MNEEKMSVAMHLYMRLKRNTGRIVDVMWLVRNEQYALEILKLAKAIPDEELGKFAKRFEQLMFSGGSRQASADSEPPALVGNRYIRTLR